MMSLERQSSILNVSEVSMLKLLLLFFLFLSCSSGATRRPINTTEISIKGGNFKGDSWNDLLTFKRYSWYRDANLTHEVLLTTLSKNSPFYHWTGEEKRSLEECQKLRIAMIYTSEKAVKKKIYLISQLEKSIGKQIPIFDFSSYIQAHPQFSDWKLGSHKVLGFCKKSSGVEKISISIPGFREYSLD